MTWTLDTPLLLNANTTHGIDVGMTTSNSNWQSGIPYLNRTADEFLGGSRYMSGTGGQGIGDTTMNNISGDMIFHLDLETPIGFGFHFLAGSPPDDTVDAVVSGQLTATFSQNLVAGTGNITIRNLTDSLDTIIPVGDSRISLSDNLLIINPVTPLLWSKYYAIRIDPGALVDGSANAFAGISDDTTWNFTTAAGDPLLDAIADLKDHILGNITLSAARIDAHKLAIDVHKGRFSESASTITTVFDLITTYDTEIGPLWVARGRFDRRSQPNDLDWTIYNVMQHIVDEIYKAPTLASHEGILSGFKFGSSANFPGAAAPPADPTTTRTVAINGSFPDTFGRDTQGWTLPARKPAGWIYAMDDPVTLMADWDAAMDAMNDLMGFPRLRGKETMYPQVDLILRSSVHAPGYPSVNTTYNPTSNYGGYPNSHLVRGPRTGWSTEFHEQGHAYFFPKFGGETEANVNLHHVAIWHRKFGFDLDYAFAASRGFAGNQHRTLDNTAVTWMTVFNFSPREVPMATAEKAYQLKGHAKFVDIVRLFGWDGLDAFWRSFNQNEEDSVSYSTSTDAMLLRLCQSVGKDIRPLFHFWGIHPSNPATLASDVAEEGLTPPVEIYDRLVHYKSLVPADNAAFRTFALGWWNKQPSINGNWTEREHARQWETTELFGEGDQQRPNGELYTEDSAASIEARVQELLDLYYPSGRPQTDYETWTGLHSGADLTNPNADLDGDGLSNDEERIWGLNPTRASSIQPVTPTSVPGILTYTRRDDALTGLTYKVWTSIDLITWNEDTGAGQAPGTLDANDTETVTVTLTPSLLTADELFVRIGAEK